MTNIAGVIKEIKLCPDLEVEIIDECDVICTRCPHNRGGVCQKSPDFAQKVREIDIHILRKLGLREGAKGKTQDFFTLVNTRLRNILDIQDICGDCDWKEKCLWFISRER